MTKVLRVFQDIALIPFLALLFLDFLKISENTLWVYLAAMIGMSYSMYRGIEVLEKLKEKEKND